VRIATRRSALALAQAQLVADLLGGAQLVTLTTTGDRHRDVDDKREWIAELEDALLAGEADLAVHSAKDVPADLADGLVLAGAPRRADPRDALCGAGSLDALPRGARIGTSSLRREAALRAVRPDLDVHELRGNVDTRLRRLHEGGFDAIVLALAGLQRLGRADEAGGALDEVLPAAGQGTLALEARADDERVLEAVGAIADQVATTCLRCERALVRELGADCRTPVGALAELEPDGATLRLRAFVGRVDGSAWLRDELRGTDAKSLGAEVAQRLRSAGADEVLGR
jgi:hydroxymethylbilane synthase